LLLTGTAALLLAGCTTRSAPPTAPAAPVPPAPAEAPPPQTPPPPSPATWEDAALTPGDWRFSPAPGPEAAYGEGTTAALTFRCEPAQHRILLSRADAPAGAALTVRTSFETRTLPSGQGGAAALSAGDPFLDAVVSSRGRFAVETPGLPALILPTWPEPARVLEECRP
jgi:hypothetical protein